MAVLCVLSSHVGVFSRSSRVLSLLDAALAALAATMPESSSASDGRDDVVSEHLATVSRAVIRAFFNAEVDTVAALPRHLTFQPQSDPGFAAVLAGDPEDSVVGRTFLMLDAHEWRVTRIDGFGRSENTPPKLPLASPVPTYYDEVEDGADGVACVDGDAGCGGGGGSSSAVQGMLSPLPRSTSPSGLVSPVGTDAGRRRVKVSIATGRGGAPIKKSVLIDEMQVCRLPTDVGGDVGSGRWHTRGSPLTVFLLSFLPLFVTRCVALSRPCSVYPFLQQCRQVPHSLRHRVSLPDGPHRASFRRPQQSAVRRPVSTISLSSVERCPHCDTRRACGYGAPWQDC